MAGPNTLHFTDENFEQEVPGADVPVLVDFWAEWCGPCQMLAPIIDELAEEYKRQGESRQARHRQRQRTASKYSVQSIPTVIIFNHGQPVERIVGLRPKKEFKAALDAKTGGGARLPRSARFCRELPEFRRIFAFSKSRYILCLA